MVLKLVTTTWNGMRSTQLRAQQRTEHSCTTLSIYVKLSGWGEGRYDDLDLGFIWDHTVCGSKTSDAPQTFLIVTFCMPPLDNFSK